VAEELTYNVGKISDERGNEVRIWIMDEANRVCCANLECRKPLKTSDAPVSITFPPKRGKKHTDIIYFCTWDCLATFVNMNEETMSALTPIAPLIDANGVLGTDKDKPRD